MHEFIILVAAKFIMIGNASPNKQAGSEFRTLYFLFLTYQKCTHLAQALSKAPSWQMNVFMTTFLKAFTTGFNMPSKQGTFQQMVSSKSQIQIHSFYLPATAPIKSCFAQRLLVLRSSAHSAVCRTVTAAAIPLLKSIHLAQLHF